MSELKSVTMYTDGGCDPNPGLGGYGVVLLYGARRRELSGAFRLTTNNRMEIMAALAGLEAMREPCRVEIRSDSKYLVNAVEKRWLEGWAARGWIRKDGRPVPNRDLWKRLMELCRKHEVKLTWVRGHSGVAENERCDVLAAQARRAADLPDDAGYLASAHDNALFEIAERPPEVEAPAPRKAPPASAAPVREEGQPCRKCCTPVVRRVPKRTKKSGKLYVYLYYLYCVGCKTLYLVDAAKSDPADRTRSAPPPRPAPPPVLEPPVVLRILELSLDRRPDPARFAEVARRLEREVGATPVRRLDGADQRLVEFRLMGKTLSLELHPERGITIQVRGKRNQDLLLELARRLGG